MGHDVTLVHRGRASAYAGASPPPASSRLWFRKRLDLEACSVEVRADDEALARALAPAAVETKRWDLALLEVGFDARFGDRPAAHVALARFRAARVPPSKIAVLTDALHYRRAASTAARERAAAVYGYERLLYAHPGVDLVVSNDKTTASGVRALQVRALAKRNDTTAPEVVDVASIGRADTCYVFRFHPTPRKRPDRN